MAGQPPTFASAPVFVPAAQSIDLAVSPASSLKITKIEGATVVARVIEFVRDAALVGEWYSEDTHYFDMTMTSRPSGVKARFEGVFDDLMSYGKTIFVPAGYRLRSRGIYR